jgi:hypothetical protein
LTVTCPYTLCWPMFFFPRTICSPGERGDKKASICKSSDQRVVLCTVLGSARWDKQLMAAGCPWKLPNRELLTLKHLVFTKHPWLATYSNYFALRIWFWSHQVYTVYILSSTFI